MTKADLDKLVTRQKAKAAAAGANAEAIQKERLDQVEDRYRRVESDLLIDTPPTERGTLILIERV